MSQPKTLEAKVIYRSNHSQLAMISIMKYGGIWDRLGLEVTRLDLERRALPAEDQLLDGRCNMIFGCHITPHWRVAHGVPMVCMAQTVNTAQDMLVSTKIGVGSCILLLDKCFRASILSGRLDAAGEPVLHKLPVGGRRRRS
jgi:hypothetical protein